MMMQGKHRFWGRLAILALVLVGGSLGPAEALAQTGERAPMDERQRIQRARELFGEGLVFVDEERWADAEARFRAALALKETPAIEYNLASALVEQQEYAEADALIASVLANMETPRDVRRLAERLAEMIEARSGQVTVEVDNPPEGAVVKLDGWVVPPERVGRPLRVAPGPHTATVERRGRELARADVQVSRARSATARLHVVDVPTPADTAAASASGETGAAAATETHGESAPLVEGDIFRDWRFWAAVGGTVLVLTIVAVAVATSGPEDPIEGNFAPGVLLWD